MEMSMLVVFLLGLVIGYSMDAIRAAYLVSDYDPAAESRRDKGEAQGPHPDAGRATAQAPLHD